MSERTTDCGRAQSVVHKGHGLHAHTHSLTSMTTILIDGHNSASDRPAKSTGLPSRLLVFFNPIYRSTGWKNISTGLQIYRETDLQTEICGIDRYCLLSNKRCSIHDMLSSPV